MHERIQCGGLIQRDELCLVEILGFRWTAGQSCGILGKFAEAGIPLSFLNIGADTQGLKTMLLCMARSKLPPGEVLLQRVQEEFKPTCIHVVDGVTILTLYGPHFNEKVALASEAYSALCLKGIDTLAVGSSVNSISVVVAADKIGPTRAALSERFQWPE